MRLQHLESGTKMPLGEVVLPAGLTIKERGPSALCLVFDPIPNSIYEVLVNFTGWFSPVESRTEYALGVGESFRVVRKCDGPGNTRTYAVVCGDSAAQLASV